MQPPPSRGMLYGPDRSGRMAYGQNKRIDQRQPQSTGGARAGMRGRRDPQPVARARPGSSVQGDSCRGNRSKTIPQLSHVSPDIQMRPLPAVGAGLREARVQYEHTISGDDASLGIVTPPYTMGLIKDGLRSRSWLSLLQKLGPLHLPVAPPSSPAFSHADSRCWLHTPAWRFSSVGPASRRLPLVRQLRLLSGLMHALQLAP